MKRRGMLKGRISEFPKPVYRVQKFKNTMFFQEGNRIWTIDKRGVHKFFENNKLFSGTFCEQGFWICLMEKTGSGEEKFHDELRGFDDREQILGVMDDFPISDSEIVDNLAVVLNCRSENGAFSVKNLENSETYTIENAPIYNFSVCDGFIYTNDIYEKIECFDYQLNKIWERDKGKVNYSASPLAMPMPYKDSVIVNIGSDDNRCNGEILSLAKNSGDILWSRVLENDISACVLVDDRVCLAAQGQMVVLDAGSGEILVDEPSGFEKDTMTEGVCFDGNNLLFINPRESKIRVFTADGKQLLQELKIPMPYMPSQYAQMIYRDGRYYLPLELADMTLGSACSGLLILEKSDNGDGSVVIEKWPVNSTVIRLENETGEEYYHVLVTGETLDDVLRYGEIKLQEVISARGSHNLSDERRNEKFNGELLFSANIDDLGKDAEEKIQYMIQSVEDINRRWDVRSGNGEHQISVKLAPLPPLP
jgi:hypothetical protein